MTDYEASLIDLRKAQAAQARLSELLQTDAEDLDGNYQNLVRDLLTSDLHSLHAFATTEKLQDDFADWGFTEAEIRETIELLVLISGNEYLTDYLSDLAMGMSLCPIHFVDWAICFDDQPDECSQIRAIFPHSHDT